MMDRYFGVTASASTIPRELRAGITTSAHIESASGISEGGRTGLVAVLLVARYIWLAT